MMGNGPENNNVNPGNNGASPENGNGNQEVVTGMKITLEVGGVIEKVKVSGALEVGGIFTVHKSNLNAKVRRKSWQHHIPFGTYRMTEINQGENGLEYIAESIY